MREVRLEAHVPGAAAITVFQHVARFGGYPDLTSHVKSVDVHQAMPSPSGSSSWELYFRSGLLRWTEREHFAPDRLRIDFEQEKGDFDALRGSWSLRDRDGGCSVLFEVRFDFGMPSLESILDPIAERVIVETVGQVLAGGYPGTEVAGRAAVPTTTAAR